MRSIAILTPYAGQVRLIKQELRCRAVRPGRLMLEPRSSWVRVAKCSMLLAVQADSLIGQGRVLLDLRT